MVPAGVSLLSWTGREAASPIVKDAVQPSGPIFQAWQSHQPVFESLALRFEVVQSTMLGETDHTKRCVYSVD